MKKIMFNDKFLLTQAVVGGTKTMTRRLLKEGTPLGNWEETAKCLPYKVGDIVAIAQPYKDIIECMAEYSDIIINVDGSINREYKAGWTNKMFVKADLMPHHIRITDVKIERLHDISDEDIICEGIRKDGCMYVYNKTYIRKGNTDVNPIYCTTPMSAFASLMYKVCDGEIWESNPWVGAYSFELVD
ncbi:hypothetical protein ABVC73_04875 [Prevotella melaninogenica]